MYSTPSSSYFSPVKRKRGTGSELPTAVKSYYNEGSPSRIEQSKSIQSPSRLNHQIKGVRQSINQIIDDVAEKRQTANYAVKKVKEVNDQAIGLFKSAHQPFTPKKYPQHSYHKSERNFPSSPETNYYHHPAEFSQKNRETDIETENLELKAALNDQLKENNDLMKEIANLRSENNSLKRRGGKGIPSHILEELENLKRENETLRQNTIRLLERNKRY